MRSTVRSKFTVLRRVRGRLHRSAAIIMIIVAVSALSLAASAGAQASSPPRSHVLAVGYEQTGERDAVGWHHLEGRVLAQRNDPEAPSACLRGRLIEIRSESRGLGEAPVEVKVDSTERACTKTVDSYQFDSLRWEAEVKAGTIPTTLDTWTYERPVGGVWALKHREVSRSSVTFDLTWTAKADGIPRAGTCGDSYYWWPFFTPHPEECVLFVHRPGTVTGTVNFEGLDATLDFAHLDGALGEDDYQKGQMRLRLRP